MENKVLQTLIEAVARTLDVAFGLPVYQNQVAQGFEQPGFFIQTPEATRKRRRGRTPPPTRTGCWWSTNTAWLCWSWALERGDSMLYRTLKRMIERGQTQGMAEKLDIFYAADKLSQGEYLELAEMLEKE